MRANTVLGVSWMAEKRSLLRNHGPKTLLTQKWILATVGCGARSLEALMRNFVGSLALATLVSIGSALSLSAPANATSVYYGPGEPNQNWTGSLGLDFIVNSQITIDALGAYNGGVGSITVAIFTGDGTTQLIVPTSIDTTTYSVASPYTFQSVTPITLGPGTYQVTAWGYGPTDNFNTGFGGTLGFNTLGGALTEGNPYYNDQGVTGFANQHLDDFNGGGLHFYGAGNFDAFATPLPSTWLMLLSGFVGLSFFAYRRTKKSGAALVAA
jgi:hypothetical protein